MIDSAIEAETDLLRISLPDAEDNVDSQEVNLPLGLMQKLSENNIDFEIRTANGWVTIPNESLEGVNEDFYFRFVPVKDDTTKEEVVERAKTNVVIATLEGAENLEIFGRPMTIETNLQDRLVTLFIPIGDVTLTQEQIDNIGVYIEHSDGTKEFIKGVLKTIDGINGVEFNTEKFSIFTVMSLTGAEAYFNTDLPETGEGFPVKLWLNVMILISIASYLLLLAMRRRNAQT